MKRGLLRRLSSVIAQPSLHDLKTKPEFNFVLTSDFYRVDIGLIICRRPVFLSLDPIEVEKIKKDHSLYSKHGLYPYVSADLFKFGYNDLYKEFKGSEEETSHALKNSNGQMTYYKENSKYFKYVDPDITDLKSIQRLGCYNLFLIVKKKGKWQFPTKIQSLGNSLNFTVDEYIQYLQQGNWESFFPAKYPLAINKEKIEEEDIKANPHFNKCQGRKVFYYQLYHDKGITNKLPDEFEDFAWITKPELNKFFTKEDFEFFAPYLKLTNQ